MKKIILSFLIMLLAFISTFLVSVEVKAATNSYYASCEGLTGDSLLEELAEITLANHKTKTSYDSLKTHLKETDPDPNSSGKILDFYSRISTSSWNREHVWPKSLSGGTYENSKGGADVHHIRPTINAINSKRGNKKFTDFELINESYDEYYYDGVLTAYETNSYWEPLDNVKGDTARIVMYMYMHYSKEVSANSGFSYAGNMQITNVIYGGGSEAKAWDLLLYWNELDPVDAYEANRNEVCADITGTRNPFIDYPSFANAIWGSGESVTPDDNIGGGTVTPDEPSQPSTPTTPDEPVVTGSTATLVKDVNDLKVNDKIIIAASGSNYALGTTQNGNNRSQAAISKSEDNLTFDSTTQIITLTNGTATNSYAFYVGNGYLYAAGGTGKNNYLRTQTTLTETASWSINISSSGSATIKTIDSSVVRNTIMHNSGSSIFSCYASGQQGVSIYKVIEDTPSEINYVLEVNKLFDKYFNDGIYVKDTSINLTVEAKEDLINYFHANTNILQRTTYYKNDELWMSKENDKYSYYGTNDLGLTYAETITPNVTPENISVVVKDRTMLDYYTTLQKIKENEAFWNKDGNIYYTTDKTVLKYYLDFTAPCLLEDIFNSNYFTYEKATVEVVEDNLVMRLYIDKEMHNSLSSAEYVLSEATISITDYSLLEKAKEEILLLEDNVITEDYELPTNINGVKVDWSGDNVVDNVLTYIKPKENTQNTLNATLTIGDYFATVSIYMVQGIYGYIDFTDSQKEVFIDYIGEVIPFLPNNLYDVEYNLQNNYVHFYTYGNTLEDYNKYQNSLLENNYIYSEDIVEDNYTYNVYLKNDITLKMTSYISSDIYEIHIYVSKPIQTPVEKEMVVFEFGDNISGGHKDGTGTISSFTEGDYTISFSNMSKVFGDSYDENGNSCIKLGSSSAAGSFTLTIPEGVSKVYFYVSGHKDSACSVTINGESYNVSTTSNSGNYTEIAIETTGSTTITFATNNKARAMLNTIKLALS